MAIACQLCPAPHAAVHLTEIDPDGSVRELHVCRACVERLGIVLDNPPRLADLLAAAPVEPAAEPAVAATSSDPRSEVCPGCGLTFAEYVKTNIFGCPRCYRVFSNGVGELIHRYHEADHHVGRLPEQSPRDEAGEDAQQIRLARRQSVQAALRQAVEREEYERAAALRDELAQLDATP